MEEGQGKQKKATKINVMSDYLFSLAIFLFFLYAVGSVLINVVKSVLNFSFSSFNSEGVLTELIYYGVCSGGIVFGTFAAFFVPDRKKLLAYIGIFSFVIFIVCLSLRSDEFSTPHAFSELFITDSWFSYLGLTFGGLFGGCFIRHYQSG